MCKTLSAVALVLCLFTFASFALAQGISDVYQVNYFSTAVRMEVPAYPDSAVRIINPGEQGTPLSAKHGAVCADIYVFDANQEMSECCSCPVTANGLLIFSVNYDLNGNPLTGFPAPPNGVIKIVSDSFANCDPTSPVPTPDLRAFATHLQTPDGSHVTTTESEFADAALQQDELSFLGQACSFVLFLGSGKGSCSCPVEVATM
ncbi:MAG TPA: hypothetical protein VEG30_00895 [Terriglobales bacterium]|nr:hypothetical protein [Terriglobales bacterium]